MAEEAGLIETSPYQAEESGATTFAHNNYSIKSYAGETLYDTAAEIATSAHPSSDWVIIASGNSFVDTLTWSDMNTYCSRIDSVAHGIAASIAE